MSQQSSPNARQDSPAHSADGSGGAVRVVRSEQLLDRGGRVIIEHKGERYALRETRLGKLILTK